MRDLAEEDREFKNHIYVAGAVREKRVLKRSEK